MVEILPATHKPTAPATRRGGVRWGICILLFLATVLGYIDRGLIGFLKGDLQHDLHWNERDYANVVAAFSLAYAFGQLLAGRLMDLIGVRRGFVATVGFWSLAAAAHAFARTLLGFESARFALGLAEGGNYPGATKSVSEWFPKKERALAAGIFNAGSNAGAVVTPILATFIMIHLGFTWRACFVAAGALGMVWLIPWLGMYRSPRQHPRVSAAELAHINSDLLDSTGSIPWARLLGFRATWAFVIGLSLTSPIWWFYLYWFPDFLVKSFHLTQQQQQLPIVAVYLFAGVGSIGGGWISSTLIRRGRSVNFGRKVALAVCAMCVLPVFFAPRAAGLWPATALVALAVAAHQGFASNLFTLISDMLPSFAVSSATGIGGMCAGLVAMMFQKFSGSLLQTHRAAAYTILFAICAAAYPVALLCVHLLAPRLAMVKFSTAREST